MPKTYIEHRLDIYSQYTLFVTQSPRGWSAIGKKLGNSLHKLDPRDGGSTQELIWRPNIPGSSEHFIVIYINPHHSLLEYIDTIAHEATHAALAIGARVHLGDVFTPEYNTNPNEPFPYLVGWITRWLYENTQTPSA